MIDVEMPDGTVVSGVPDNVSRSDVLRRYNALTDSSSPKTVAPDETPEMQQYINDFKTNLETYAQANFTPEQLKEADGPPLDAWDAVKGMGWQNVPLGGFVEGKRIYNVYDISKKIQSGEDVSAADRKTMNDFMFNLYKMNKRGTTWGHDVTEVVSVMPAWMVEIAATSASLGAAGASIGARLGAKGLEKAAQKVAAKTAAGTAAAGTAASALGTGQIYKGVAERRVLNNLELTDKGEAIFKNAEESLAKSVMMAASHHGIEIGTEYLGGTLTRAAGKVIPVNRIFELMPAAARDKLIRAAQFLEPNKTVKDILVKSAWSNLPAEMGEERAADFLHATLEKAFGAGLTDEQYLDQIIPSWRQLAVEAGAFSVPGIVGHTGSGLMKMLEAKGMNKAEARQTVESLTEADKDKLFTEMSKEFVAASLDKVRDDSHKQFIEAGVPEDEATANAEILRAFALVGAQESNVSPGDYLRALNLSVVKGKDDEVPSGLLQTTNFGTDRSLNKMYELALLAADYKSFKKLITQEHLMDLSDQEKHRFGRAFTHYEDEPLQDIKYFLDEDPQMVDNFKYYDRTTYNAIIFPTDTVVIYRAVPQDAENKIRVGDYVTLNRSYAEGHLRSVIIGEQKIKGKIIKATVPKEDVVWGQADALEWAYSPREQREKFRTTKAFYDFVKSGQFDKNTLYQEVSFPPVYREIRRRVLEEGDRARTASGWKKRIGDYVGRDAETRNDTKAVRKWLGNIQKENPNTQVPSEDVADFINDLEDEAAKGNILYQSEVNGSIKFYKDGKKIITLFEGADRSTLIHELAHMFLRETERLAGLSETAKDRLSRIRDHLGAKEGEAFTTAQEEQFAREFERYMAEGKAPNARLAMAFEAFKRWMLKIYKSLSGLGIKINDDIRGVFDEMLGGKGLDIYDLTPKIDEPESIWATFYRYWVDDMAPVHKIVKAFKERIGSSVPDGMDDILLVRAYGSVVNRITATLQHNTYYMDDSGNRIVTGEGLKAIADDFDEEMRRIEPDYLRRRNDLADHLKAKRYMEDLAQTKDIKVTDEQKAESVRSFARLAEKYGDEYLRFEHYGERIYAFEKRVLELLKQSGVISAESFENIQSKHKHYVPFQRVFDENEIDDTLYVGGRRVMVNKASVIQKMEGSKREVKDIFHNIFLNTSRVIQAAERNRICRNIARMGTFLPDYIEEAEKGGEGIVRYRDDGVLRYIRVQNGLYESINGLYPEEISFISRILSPLAFTVSVFKKFATGAPEFMFRNLARDMGTVTVQSRPQVYPWDVVKGFVHALSKPELYNKWKQSGGAFAGYLDLSDKSIEESYQELMRPNGRLMYYGKTFGFGLIEDIGNVFEQTNRMAVFGAAKRGQYSDLAAAIESRDASLDFMRAGVYGRIANRYIPFFNAGVQGTDKMVRAFKSNPTLFTMRALATITIPSVVLAGYYLFAAPDDDKNEYLEIPQWRKDIAWPIKVNGEWKYYPKPFTLGYAFATPIERFMQWTYDGYKPEGENFWRQFVMGIGGSMSPVQDVSDFMTPVGKMAVENITNYNFFTGRPIYPSWMEKLPPEERYNKYNSEFSKQVGDAVGVSPALIDNTLRNTFATSTPYVVAAADATVNAVKKWNGQAVKERPITDADRLFIRGFSVRRPSGFNAVSTQNFLKYYDDVASYHAAYSSKTGEEKYSYYSEHKNKIELYKQMKEFNDKIHAVGKKINKIWDDAEMSSQEKVEAIVPLEDSILAIAKQGNLWYLERREAM